MLDLITWSYYYDDVVLINLGIVIGLFACLRLFSGTISHINASDELLKKDNPAFGISLAAMTFALAIMLSGTIYGTQYDDANRSVIVAGIFGIFGIAMMATTRIILSTVTLPRVSLREEIKKGNIAVAFADAGNVLAAAIIIRGVMGWVYIDSTDGMLTLAAVYGLSQIILTLMTILRMRVFGAINKGYCLQEEFNNGNIALGLRFAGQKIGMAFALSTAAQLVAAEESDMVPVLMAWVFVSIVVILIWKALCFVAEKIILMKVDLNHEVLGQRNIAIGALQAVIYISLGLLISSL